MYSYYSIYNDPRLNASRDADSLREFLGNQPNLVVEGPNAYANAEGIPFIKISLLLTPGFDSWSLEEGFAIDVVNLIDIVANPKDEPEEESVGELVYTIADFLDWEVFREG